MIVKSIVRISNAHCNYIMLSNRDLQEILKNAILYESGLETICEDKCKLISQMIFMQSKSYISETSIKKLFGFIESSAPFTPFVLDSLSFYCGYNSFSEFCSSHENEY